MAICEDRSLPLVLQPVNREPVRMFPALHSSNAALEIGSDLLPGVETVVGSVRQALMYPHHTLLR